MKNPAFKPKQTTKKLLAVLPERAAHVLVGRFGLGAEPEKKTLESIGKKYGITRERVRQIENFALHTIKKSAAYTSESHLFDELKDYFVSLGAVLTEEDFLNAVSKDKSTQNHAHFLLVLGDAFLRDKEDEQFRVRWSVDKGLSAQVHKALEALYQGLAAKDLISENEMLAAFKKRLGTIPAAYDSNEIFFKWLRLSKTIGRNQLGEWGLAASPNIKIRGIRDYAYLVIRRHGSPLHFAEVAKLITNVFGRPSHPATCHNELIKDKERFVLVGRGLYGLAEWGYTDGVVKDVIIDILKKHGALKREELVSKVLKERHVKENTVLVNLQNKKYFKRDEGGIYTLV
ncbi:MAG: hypothetical protein HYY60_00390 [Parcubacteria group bacterium]|nr:hypothetical protein [Parcubacteria group bacterium]